MLKRALPVLLSLAVIHCAPAVEAPPSLDRLAQRADRIIGGTDAPDDIAVVELVRNNEGFCTGTLIGAKTVITAAHCVNGLVPGPGVVARFWQKSGTQYVTSDIQIASASPHTGYDGVSHDYDVALVELISEAPHPSAKLIPHLIDQSYVGRDVRHVGYGYGSAARDQVTYAIRQVTANGIEGAATGKNTCFGDSGGPAFVRPDGGEEFLVGVVSWGDGQCSQIGWDQRVDIVNHWVRTTAATWEAPTCDADLLCKQGCTPVDPDCACALDGVCNATCGGFTPDSDCANCGADGVCSTVQCPEPEPESDCRPDGQPCPNPTQCQGLRCTSDTQHSEYCTRVCASTDECISGMECNGGLCKYRLRTERDVGESCTAEDLCIGLFSRCAPDGHCRNGCTSTNACFTSGESCVIDPSGNYCAPAPAPEPEVRMEEPAVEPPPPEVEKKGGCAAAPAGAQALIIPFAMMLMNLRRRKLP